MRRAGVDLAARKRRAVVQSSLFGAGLLGLGSVAAGCAGELDNPDQFMVGARAVGDAGEEGGASVAAPDGDGSASEPGCPDVVTEFFAARCVGSSCHGSDSDLALDLESPGVASRVVGTSGTNSCSGEVLLDPSAPEESLLLAKLGDSPPCGSPMPLGSFGDALPTEEERACVLEWIEATVDTAMPGGDRDGGSSPAAGQEDSGSPSMPPPPMPSPDDGGSMTPPDSGAGDEDAAVVAIPDPTEWSVSASHSSSDPPEQAIDGDPSTRWSSGKAQSGDEWFEVDLGSVTAVSQIVLDSTGSDGDYPRMYAVSLAVDAEDYGAPVAEGAGDGAVTTIAFDEAPARFIRIEQTGSTDTPWWSIHELSVSR